MANLEAVNFDIADLLKRAWEIFTRNAAVLVGAVLVAGIIVVVASSVAGMIHEYLSTAVSVLLAGPFLLGFYRMALVAARGQSVYFGMIFEGFNNLMNAVLANLIVTVFCALGFMLCIVPGILIFALYITTFLFMADGQRDFWGAMESSRKFTLSNYGPWVILALISLVLHAAGAALCGLGLLIAAPVTTIMVALAYEQQRFSGAVAVDAEVLP